MWAEAMAPTNFRFEAATMDPPYVVDSYSRGNILVVNSIGNFFIF